MQHGDVVVRLCKANAYNPFSGIQWQLWDALNPSIPRVDVRKAFLRGDTFFETVDGVSLTRMTQKLGDAFSELQWDDCTYRQAFAAFLAVALLCSDTTSDFIAQLILKAARTTAPAHPAARSHVWQQGLFPQLMLGLAEYMLLQT